MQSNKVSIEEITNREKRPEWFQPEAKPLDEKYHDAAYAGQILTYPRIVRSNKDPIISGQNIGIVSFMQFDKPMKLKNGRLVYAFFKVRGVYESVDVATAKAKELVRNVDSKFRMLLSPVGEWLPVLDDDSAVKDILEVTKDDQEKSLRDEAAKKKQQEDERIMREIREKEHELRTTGDIYDNPESIEYYTMKRTTESRLTDEMELKKIQQESMREKRTMVRDELYELEKKHPEYHNKWVDVVNAKRKESGTPAFVPKPGQFEEYEEYIKNKSKE